MKEKFKVLDVFRGICASLVVLYHLYPFAATPVINNSFILNSDLFVDFFFALSGFVIAYNYQFIVTGNDLKLFFRRRFLRLYPLHFVLLATYISIELMRGIASHYVHFNKVNISGNTIYTAITNLFLVNSIKFPFVHDLSYNGPSWSISAEMIAYLVFGLTIIVVNRNKLGRIKPVIYLIIIITAAFSLYMATRKYTFIYSYNYGFLRSIIGFFTGVLCFNAYHASKTKAGNLSNLTYHILEPALIITVVLMVCNGGRLRENGFIFEALFFLVLLVFSFERGWISRLLKKSKILHQTGKYSYSIYMTNDLLISLFNILFIRVLKFPPSAYLYLFILNYLVIYMVSSCTFKNIEMRFYSALPQQNNTKGWWLW